MPDRREIETEETSHRISGVRMPIITGFLIIGSFFGALGVWGGSAPLESAAIAQGTVSVDSSRKTIQHLEGGIVAEILVRDGDTVSPEQPLVRLDNTRAKATLDLLRGRMTATRALEARLKAERDKRNAVTFPASLVDQRHIPQVAETIEGQRKIFNSRKDALASQIAIQNRRIGQLAEEISGLHGQIKAETTQLGLINTEIRDLNSLVAKGWARKPRLLSLKRRSAEIEGSLSQNKARIARAKQTIDEIRLRIEDLHTTAHNKAVVELREVQSEVFDLSERMRAAEDVLNRTSITAPIAGTVVGLQVHTTGGVVSPGDTLMQIVPAKDRLIVEARVDPSDIDVVHPGLTAQVRLTPLNARNTAPLEGKLIAISADRLTDQRSGQTFYLARIELIEPTSANLGGASLYPGMPAEVMIVTGARTMLGYLLEPMAMSLRRAFREN